MYTCTRTNKNDPLLSMFHSHPKVKKWNFDHGSKKNTSVYFESRRSTNSWYFLYSEITSNDLSNPISQLQHLKRNDLLCLRCRFLHLLPR